MRLSRNFFEDTDILQRGVLSVGKRAWGSSWRLESYGARKAGKALAFIDAGYDVVEGCLFAGGS